MKADIEQLVMRSVVAMLRVAAGTNDTDVRDDVSDDSLGLLRALILNDTDALARASRESITRVESVASDDASVARALVLLLRLSSRVKPAEPIKAPKKVLQPHRAPTEQRVPGRPRMHDNQKLVLGYIREQPGIRTGELRALCAGRLSDRTALRSLKELVAMGVIERLEGENGTVSYQVKSEI